MRIIEPNLLTPDRRHAKMENLVQGTVKWFDAKKGYGFIECDSGEDIFVHFKSIKSSGYRQLTQGQRVEFTISKGTKGLQADDVTPISQ